MADFVTCASCGAFIEGGDGPTHEYIGAPAGCWKLYGHVLARDYGEYNYPEPTHHLAVAAYAAQHPGAPGRKQQQSVNLHLVALYLLVERGVDAAEIPKIYERMREGESEFLWLKPPRLNKGKNVSDVVRATDQAAHEKQVAEWAASVWKQWAPHHDHVRALALKYLQD